MVISIEIAEARDAYGIFAVEVSDVRCDVSFVVADKLRLGDLYRKIKTTVDEHLNTQLHAQGSK